MSNTKSFKKNQVIFFEGEKGETMYDIVYGTVGIYSDYGKPEQKLLTKLGPESFFGEMGMIEKLPRSATAVALENTDAIEIKDRPAKAYTILQHTSKRLRDLSCDYVDACVAISEYVQAEEDGVKPSDALLERMKKINAARTKKK